MGRVRSIWNRVSGTAVCLAAVALPYRPRLLLAKILNYIANPPKATASLILKRQLKFWNGLIMGLVFYIGLPVPRLFLLLGGRKRLAPPPGSKSYWVERPSPEKLDQEIQELF